MALINDLKTITPIYNHHVSRGSVDILEHGGQATVTKVTWHNSDFNNIDAQLAKDATSFFTICNAPEVFRKDCDGIMTFERDGKKYMFLTELKSNFSTQDLVKAKSQIMASFIKTNMILHLLSSYKIEDYTVKGFIVGHPPKTDFLVTLHQLTSLPKDDQKRREYDLAMRLFLYSKDCHTTLTPKDFFCIKGLPLGNRGVFPKIDLHFIEVPYGSSSTTLDVTNYL